ncbi:MAG TPA: hypothetical protein VFP68_13490 [Burkholderiaceae bacterium]|nr:hypothetical protein [Burkholderiaceae bacterium]
MEAALLRAAGTSPGAIVQLALLDVQLQPANVSDVNAHGIGTIQGDLSEVRAIETLFGGSSPPVTAIKGSTGHMIAGSGAVEAIMTLLSLRPGCVPPVAGMQRRDPAVALDAVQDSPRPVKSDPALSNSFGFGGMNTSLVLAGTDWPVLMDIAETSP